MNKLSSSSSHHHHHHQQQEEEQQHQQQLGLGGSMIISSSDLIDAKLEEHQLCGSKQCPGCGHHLHSKPDWVGLPAGVKFDPTDQELIEHLEAKVEAKHSKSHPLIDEFIPTIQGEDGICYTHPEKLPGVTRDGLSRHFFHRPSKAYTTGTRKRRKIQTESCHDHLQAGGETRWHKTGKTRPVMLNGKQKGCKKILVLYTNFGKNRRPEKTNWVMHQYHLGQHEEEKEGELVVSKIFYQTQPRQCNWSSTDPHRNNTKGSDQASSREVVISAPRDHQDQFLGASMSGSGYGGMDIQQLKAPHDHFSFVPFRKSFDEVGIGDASAAREASGSGTCEERDMRDHQRLHHHHHPHHHDHDDQQQINATEAFHISRPSNPISAAILPPPPPPHPTIHHTSIILDQDPFHVSRMLLHNDHNFQQHHNHQNHPHHQKLGGDRSASGLEELIMSCSTSTTDHIKEVPSITNPQEAEWLKYSSFWPDPDNPDHHG